MNEIVNSKTYFFVLLINLFYTYMLAQMPRTNAAQFARTRTKSRDSKPHINEILHNQLLRFCYQQSQNYLAYTQLVLTHL